MFLLYIFIFCFDVKGLFYFIRFNIKHEKNVILEDFAKKNYYIYIFYKLLLFITNTYIYILLQNIVKEMIISFFAFFLICNFSIFYKNLITTFLKFIRNPMFFIINVFALFIIKLFSVINYRILTIQHN
ncbi:hypothetical protein EDEG_03612 [Edhazardia aedis USNM 41457]|uniref:Uncharacterized protein n=1 Tax=Edhazardia aedis (strain USNM 41457) TaxID=1003232 RepID=J8ZQE7_EDHAE|nr:hypothetical protein EDEG_03612 [Edhazardia aedis USNM 41457]|eukprot:EJW01923.1 hypothetical protein EDEG_03612 [Edhazardia aedis USNM 41457]